MAGGAPQPNRYAAGGSHYTPPAPARPPARPVPMRTVSPPRQMQTSHTAAIAQQGQAAIDALKQRRQAAGYGLGGQRQALQDTYQQIQSTGQGYSSHPGATDPYTQWMQSKGFGSTDYPVTFGQTPKGAYSGFKTEGELKSAIIGSAEMAREQDRQQAQAMRDMLNSKLGGLDQSTETNRMGAGAAYRDARNRAPMGGDVLGQRLGDYNAQLDDWYAKQAEPLVTGLETANQIERTPTRDYATVAAQQFGVDPRLVHGWFPEAQEITDATNQRDLESLHTTGLPYSEQQQVLQGMDRANEQGATQADADRQAQMDDEIYQATSFNGSDLANAAQAPVEAIHQIVTDPYYAGVVNTIETVKAQAEQQSHGDEQAIQDAVDNAIQLAIEDTASEDPTSAQVLERILRAQYGG